MFQGSTSAPHSIARCSRSSTSSSKAAAAAELPAVDLQLRRGQAAVDVALHPRRGDRHDADLPRRPPRCSPCAAKSCARLTCCNCSARRRARCWLKCCRAPPSGCRSARASARSRSACGAGKPRQQPLVEGVAIDGDLLHQRGQGDAGIVGVGPIAADAGAHQHRPRQHGGLLEQDLLVGQVAALGNPLEHGVQRDLLQDEAAAAARVVQLAQVPLAEEVVGPLVDRMVEVVGPGIDGQLVQQRRIEHGLQQQHRIGGLEDRQRPLDQVVVAARGHARPANVQRDGPHPFVGVGLDLLLRAQHGDRAMAEVVVQTGEWPPRRCARPGPTARPAAARPRTRGREKTARTAPRRSGGTAGRDGAGDRPPAGGRRPASGPPRPGPPGGRRRSGREGLPTPFAARRRRTATPAFPCPFGRRPGRRGD